LRNLAPWPSILRRLPAEVMRMQEQERTAGPGAGSTTATGSARADGNYLWPPKKDRSGERNASYDNIPGDIVY